MKREAIDTKDLIDILEDTPIVTAIKDDKGLEKCLEAPSKFVFVLYGDICNIGQIVKKLKEHGKYAVVHLDLIEGLESKPISVKFLKENTLIDGIISTKIAIIKAAKKEGLITVMRFFALDSLSIENIKKHVTGECIDFIEVLPGVAPKVIGKLAAEIDIPLIAGGLIADKEDVIAVLQKGAIAISTSNEQVWTL